MGKISKIIYRCDRCGVEQEGKEKGEKFLDIEYRAKIAYNNLFTYTIQQLYLCPKCKIDFMKFMRGKLKEDEW